MYHTRNEVIERTIREFELLDQLLVGLRDKDWERLLIRTGTKDPWSVKDAVAHITHWKADVARSVRRQRRPAGSAGWRRTKPTISSICAGMSVLLRMCLPGTGRFRRI